MIATLGATVALTFGAWRIWARAWSKGYMAALDDRDVIDDVFGRRG